MYQYIESVQGIFEASAVTIYRIAGNFRMVEIVYFVLKIEWWRLLEGATHSVED